MNIKKCKFDNNQTSSYFSFGERLRESREAMGLSQQKVADSLCLKLFVIRGIEEGHIDTLGITSTFLYGYIRSYARLVGLDTEEIVVPFLNGPLCHHSPNIKKKCNFFYFFKKNIKNSRLLVGIFILFNVVVIIIWCLKYFFLEDKHFKSFNTYLMMSIPTYKWDRKYLSFSLEKNFSNIRNFNIFFDKNYYFANIRQPLFFLDPYFSEILLDGLFFKVNDFSLYENIFFYQFGGLNFFENINGIDCTDSNILIMSFTADCWIEVVDYNGKILFIGTQHAGNVLNLIGEIPYSVVVGAPQSIEIKYQGTVINLDEFIHFHKIARLTIPSYLNRS